MSSLRRVAKSNQKTYKERHQPQSRQHLGVLEKKKDYKKRANDFQRKQNALKSLRKKALDKNPNEFHFHMINSHTVDGVHYDIRKDDKEFTADELKLLQTQDANYVNHKLTIETNKIERLKSSLHLIDVEDKPKNSHIFFVDNKEEKKRFDFAKRLNTSRELLDIGFNFANIDQMKAHQSIANCSDNDLQSVAHLRDKSYKELAKRVERQKFLKILSEKMAIKKKLLNKNDAKPKKIKKGTETRAPVYKWKTERKR